MGTRIICGSLAALFFATPLAGQQAAPSGTLLQQAKWLRFEVSGGCIVARSERCNQSRHAAEQSPTEGVRQTLVVDGIVGGFTVQYDQQDGGSRLVLQCDGKGQVVIRRELADPASLGNVELVQSATGKVALRIAGPVPRQIVADDLWQLLLAEQAVCRAHLLPLLAELPIGGQWERQAGEVESALLAQAGTDVQLQKQQWLTWIGQLASSSFAERHVAELALRSSGQAALAFCRQLDSATLDSQQRRRLRAIAGDLVDGVSDSPECVAQRLLTDKRVWLALMGRGELPQRVAAAEHLSKLCGRPVVFDPAATAESRTAQLAELSRMLTDN